MPTLIPPSDTICCPAPAKLNLDLRIVGRRADGYHLLESVFCLIGLYDKLYVRVRVDRAIVLHTPTAGVAPEQDLSVRAARALQQASGCLKGADIWLEKHIPMGGGLGGGSSDAATVLLALNRLWATALPRQTLQDIGLALGADVPFFLFGQTAFAQGVGEQLQAVKADLGWYVVVHPPVHVPTAKIFSHPDLTRDSKPSIMPSLKTAALRKNDMQAVVCKEYPEVAQALSLLKPYGQAWMSGSGSCVFAEFNEEAAARAVAEKLEHSSQNQCYCVPGLPKHPLYDWVD